MPLGLLGSIGLPALSSITGGGNLASSTPSSSTADSMTGAVHVGGLNVPALPSSQNRLILAGGAVAIAWLIWGRK